MPAASGFGDSVSPDLLLSQGRALRAVARSLLKDEHAAEDAVQQAYLVALENPPRDDGVFTWLRTVTRNVAWKMSRGNERRRRREQHAAVAESTTSEDLVEQGDLLRIIAAAVMELSEPYRSTMLLHYYRGIPTDEIARQEGVSPATVRSRQHRALQKLRGRLDADGRHGKGRWMAILAPWALDPAESVAAAGGAASQLAWSGPLAVTAVVLGIAGLVTVFVWPSGAGNDAVVTEPGEAATVAMSTANPEPVRAPVGMNHEEHEGHEGTRGTAPVAYVVAGQVLDPEGRPVPHAEVMYNVVTDRHALAPMQRTGELGRFVLRADTPIHNIAARASQQGRSGLYELTHPAGDRVEVTLTLNGVGQDLQGRVTGPDSQPVAGAWVRVRHTRPALGLGTVGPDDRASSVAPPALARTGADGRFHVPGIPPGPRVVTVVHPDHAPWTRTVKFAPAGEQALEVTLRAGLTLRGRVTDQFGRPVEGALIGRPPVDTLLRIGDHSDANGEYVVHGLPAGRWRILAARDQSYAELLLPADSRPGEQVTWDPVLMTGRRLEVKLTDPAGAPLADWRVEVRWQPMVVSGEDQTAAFRSAFAWISRISRTSRGRTDDRGSLVTGYPGPVKRATIQVLGPHEHWAIPLASHVLDPFEDGAVTLSADLDSQPVGRFAVELHDADGRPLAPGPVHAVAAGQRNAMRLPVEEVDGPRLISRELPAGDYWLFVHTRDQHHTPLGLHTLHPGEVTPVITTVAPAGTLRITCTGTGDAPDLLEVLASGEEHEPLFAKYVVVRERSGDTRLTGGSYRLRLHKEDAQLDVPFEVQPGQVTELRIPKD